MPRFEPFRALRYAGNGHPADISDVVSPPYDVIDAAGRTALEARSPHNSVRIDFPHDEDGRDGYQLAAARLGSWVADGALRLDVAPTFTRYRMTAPAPGGGTFTTTGVLGALTLEPPGTGDILPHEQTTPKDKADRLSLLRATRVNGSPIWGLALGQGLGAMLATDAPPHQRAVDEDGIVHEAWVIEDPAEQAKIREIVESRPIVVADGHHRFETAHAYAAERRATDGSPPAGQPYDALLALIVELAEDQLAVRPIHRIVTGLPAGAGGPAAFEPWFAVEPAPASVVEDPAVVAHLVRAGALALATAEGSWLLHPRAGAFDASITLDSERVAAALAGIAGTAVRYHHDPATVVAAGRAGEAGLLLRPVTVRQIEDVAHARTRMPAKSTFFWPKPRTGMVFRPHEPSTWDRPPAT